MIAVDELCDEVNAVVIGDASIPICDGQENANRILARSIPICDGQENANQILARTIMDGRGYINNSPYYVQMQDTSHAHISTITPL